MVGLAQPMPKKVSRSQLDRQLDRARNQGNSIEFLNSTEVFWSILEHIGHEEHGGTWHMEQLNWICKGRREKPS
ncbi:unnamed protein product [Microthlaspi erraticum]|uniref:Uncharacterized protein n=1 Tax=Microthlaspi erraticum TaxID=1685480 RepID=A0A6D2IUC7_9BRAS|nr:unnamed protein product [Microthlaspi erraticum]